MDALEVPEAVSKMYHLLLSYLLYHMLICSSFNPKGCGLLFCGCLFIKLSLLPPFSLPAAAGTNLPDSLYLLHSKKAPLVRVVACV